MVACKVSIMYMMQRLLVVHIIIVEGDYYWQLLLAVVQVLCRVLFRVTMLCLSLRQADVCENADNHAGTRHADSAAIESL